jgi:hypothetical protein
MQGCGLEAIDTRQRCVLGFCQHRIEVLGIVDHKGCLEELSVCSEHNNPAYRERSGESQEKF